LITKEIKSSKINFKMMENVQYFCDSMKTYGVKANQLFSPDHLVNKTNLMAVISGIHALATLSESRGFTPILIKTDMDGESTVPIIQKVESDRLNFLKEEAQIIKKIQKNSPKPVKRERRTKKEETTIESTKIEEPKSLKNRRTTKVT